jgi:hypothetical protein
VGALLNVEKEKVLINPVKVARLYQKVGNRGPWLTVIPLIFSN